MSAVSHPRCRFAPATGLVVAAFIVAGQAIHVRSEETTATVGPKPGPATRRTTARALVEQLGDPVFEKRVAAEQDLLDLGAEGRQALLDAGDDLNLEARTRARRLADGFVAALSRRLLERLEQPGVRGETVFPGWRHFSSVAGDSDLTRELFQKTLIAYPDLRHSFVSESLHPRDLPQDAWLNLAVPRDLHVADIAAIVPSDLSPEAVTGQWLFAFGGEPGTNRPARRGSLIHYLQMRRLRSGDASPDPLFPPERPPIDRAVAFVNPTREREQTGRFLPVLRKLLRHWIVQVDDPNDIKARIELATQLAMPDAAEELARSTLEHWANHPDDCRPTRRFHRETPMLFRTLSITRRKEHLPLLEKFLESDLEVTAGWGTHSWSPGAVVRLRDLAASAVLEIAGHDPAAWDLPFAGELVVSTAPSRALLQRQLTEGEITRARGFARVAEQWKELGLQRPPRFEPKADRPIGFRSSPGTDNGPADDPTDRVRLLDRYVNPALVSNETGRPYGESVRVNTDGHQGSGTPAGKLTWAFTSEGAFVAIAGSYEGQNGTRTGNIAVFHVATARMIAEARPSHQLGPVRAVRFAADDRTVLFDAAERIVKPNLPPPNFQPRQRRPKDDPNDGK